MPNLLKMTNRIFCFCLIFFQFFIWNQTEGQSKRVPAGLAKYKNFQVPGKVKTDSGDPGGTIINLINLDSNETEKTVTVPSSGKFDLDLSYFKEYRISVSKDGFYPKIIDISTIVPRNVWEKDSVFPPFSIIVSLYKKVEGAKLNFEGAVVGKISYSPNGKLDNFDSNIFIDDQAIQSEISKALQNNVDQKFNKKLAEALEFEKKRDLSNAYRVYTEALTIKPGNKFVIEKLKELAIDIKDLENEAKIKAGFDRLMALGDANITNLKYAEAVQNYKSAVKIIPDDPIAISKLAKAEKLLANSLDKAKQDAEFDRLIAQGDANVKVAKYAEGISSYRAALVIRPGDAPTLAKISGAEKLLAQAVDKAKKDEEFTRLVAEGDANVKVAKYAEGISSYRAALMIRPGDAPTLAKISVAEKLLAQALDKAKKDEEFTRLVAEGDLNVKEAKYAEGISSYRAALVIRPGDAPTLAKISGAEKLLAQALDKAKKDEEFTRLVAEGDANVKEAKYTEGISSYRAALVIRPGDAPTLAKISGAEKQLALLRERGVSKLYLEAINRGASFFASQQYADAIIAYREAQKIKPQEILPPQKIKEIQAILAAMAAKATTRKPAAADEDSKINASDQLYYEKTRNGDENFKTAQWTIARFYYMEALKVRAGDKYLLSRIESCDKMIDSEITSEKIKEFNGKVTTADEHMKTRNYSSARFYYRSALDIMKWESYPAQQLKLIDKIITEQLSQSDQHLFAENIKKADDAFNRKEYPGARFYYEKAKEISETDHIISRLKEIEALVNGLDSQNLKDTYDGYIKKGNDALNDKNSAVARFYFEKATILKPDEKYPKEKIKSIDASGN